MIDIITDAEAVEEAADTIMTSEYYYCIIWENQFYDGDSKKKKMKFIFENEWVLIAYFCDN